MKKAAIIGCGSISHVHARALRNIDHAEIAAVCDTDISKGKSLSQQYTSGRAAIITDWQELCQSDVEVVHICTPHYLHTPMAVELLHHGKIVFMEKPCAISRAQFEQLKQADEMYPGKLGFCFQNRYNDTTQAINKMVEDGLIGDVIGARAFVTWRRDEDYYSASDWKGRWDTEGGGVLINQSIHTLDLMLNYLGVPQLVKATMSNHHLEESIQVEDTVEAWISFENGKRACFYATNGYVTDAPIILEVQGEHGTITMNGLQITTWTPQNGAELISFEKKDSIGKDYWGLGHEACIREFYECLLQGREFGENIRGVENTFDTMMRIYEAAGSK